MNSTASKDIRWLTDEEMDSLGNYSSWFEEFLIAKCKRAPDFGEWVDLIVHNLDEWDKFEKCKDRIKIGELQKFNRSALTN